MLVFYIGTCNEEIGRQDHNAIEIIFLEGGWCEMYGGKNNTRAVRCMKMTWYFNWFLYLSDCATKSSSSDNSRDCGMYPDLVGSCLRIIFFCVL